MSTRPFCALQVHHTGEREYGTSKIICLNPNVNEVFESEEEHHLFPRVKGEPYAGVAGVGELCAPCSGTPCCYPYVPSRHLAGTGCTCVPF